MNKLNQNSMIQDLDVKEQENVNGGGLILAGIITGVVAGLVISFVDNFGDVREGISDGYAGKTPRH
ncbi:lactobin A/cerein 7B family class IIb bacteriocin [Bacteroides heparinolyticus]|uniref:lactobin A/cerein 7B family class IIb bacteriocin n=1 Tax=Prevotella heparinolytica TaxID=28113 RepID=UPI0023F54502|nr:lactobin A/cerein 7B family class IIb bacteriocin [Bacteroides heparinolyticus]MCF0255822.1 lactobin A/cerein 7B family class IIb bacteriocin [Bacteroides heparinolyticus]